MLYRRLAAQTAADTYHSLLLPTRFSARQHAESAIFTTGPVFVFGPVTAVLFGQIRMHYSAQIEYE